MPNLSLFCVETEIHPAGREPKKLYNSITKKFLWIVSWLLR